MLKKGENALLLRGVSGYRRPAPTGTEMVLVAVRVRPPTTTVAVTGKFAKAEMLMPVLVPARPHTTGMLNVPFDATLTVVVVV